MKKPPLTVALVWVGKKYDDRYLWNAWVSIFNKLNRRPYEVVVIEDECFTDGKGKPIETKSRAQGPRWVPEQRLVPAEHEGWWAKLQLFKPGTFEPGSRVLYLDLDTVVTGNLDQLVEWAEVQGKGSIVKDWHANTYNSSVMSWRAGDYDALWRPPAEVRMLENGAAEIEGRRYAGDQDWISERSTWETFPVGWCVSYRTHAQHRPPNEAKVVCFHGEPKPAEVAMKDPRGWVAARWPEAMRAEFP